VIDREDRWTAVGKRVERRRTVELGFSQADVVRTSGLSEPAVAAIAKGQPRGEPRQKTRRQLSLGLGWVPDAIDRMLEGEEPVEIEVAWERVRRELEQAPPTATNLEQLRAEERTLSALVRSWAESRLSVDRSHQLPGVVERVERLEQTVKRFEEIADLVRELEERVEELER
jgi:transcriptional regulator with XRE-family HTH domain